jgi:hypothetical protein
LVIFEVAAAAVSALTALARAGAALRATRAADFATRGTASDVIVAAVFGEWIVLHGARGDRE